MEVSDKSTRKSFTSKRIRGKTGESMTYWLEYVRISSRASVGTKLIQSLFSYQPQKLKKN